MTTWTGRRNFERKRRHGDHSNPRVRKGVMSPSAYRVVERDPNAPAPAITDFCVKCWSTMYDDQPCWNPRCK